VFLQQRGGRPGEPELWYQVAQLAGIPPGVIRTAQSVWADLEAQAAQSAGGPVQRAGQRGGTASRSAASGAGRCAWRIRTRSARLRRAELIYQLRRLLGEGSPPSMRARCAVERACKPPVARATPP
jgi:hypothetical protein